MHTPRGGWGDCQHNVHVCAANKCGGYSNKVCPELEVEEEEPASASEEPAAADSNCIDDFDAKYGAGYCAKRVHPGVWPLSDPPPHTVRDTGALSVSAAPTRPHALPLLSSHLRA